MRTNLRKQISPWMVVYETDSENDDDCPSKKNYYGSNQVTANDKDKDKVLIVDLGSSEGIASTNDEDAAINHEPAVRNKRKTKFNSKTGVRGEKISSGNDVTLLEMNAVIKDDQDDEDIELKAIVPVKNRKRKELLETVVDKRARTAQASTSKEELAFGEASEYRSAVELKRDELRNDEKKDSTSVNKYQSNGTITKKNKNKGSIKDKDVRAKSNTPVTKVKKKKKKKERKNRNKDSNSVVEYRSGKKTERKNKNKRRINDKDVEANTSTTGTEVRKKEFNDKNDVREKDQGSSNTKVTLLPRNIIDDENGGDSKLEASVPIKSRKRKVRSAATAALKRIKIIQAASLEQKLAVDEVNQHLSPVDSANDKLNEDENTHSNYYMKYQSSKEVERQDEDERPVIGFDKPNCKANTADTDVTKYKNIAMAEVRKKRFRGQTVAGQEEGSSYTGATLLSGNKITIDSDDDDQVIVLKTEIENKDEIKNASNREVKVEWSECDYLSEYEQIDRQIATNLISLFKNDDTIEFIAKYRKEMTGGMGPEQLQNMKNSYDNFQIIKQRAERILREIDQWGKWTPQVHSAVNAVRSVRELDLIHTVLKPETKGSSA